MPTKHPRIGVARDPELDAALKRAEERLGREPAATLVRELALRGDKALAADGPPLDPNDPRAAQRALRELREEKLR